MHFDQATVCDACLQMHIVIRPSSTVCDRNVECGCKRGDFDRLGKSAADSDIRLRIVDCFVKEKVAETKQAVVPS